MQTPRMRKLTWGSELWLSRENFWDIIILQFVSSPPPLVGVWELIILPVCHSYYLCDIFFVLGHRISYFCRFLPSLSIVQRLVVILVFSWEEVSSRSSAPLSCLLNLDMCFSVFLLQAKSASPHPDLVSATWLDVANRIWAKSLSEPMPRS